MVIRKVAALIGAAAVVVAACGGGATASPGGGGGEGCTVGVSWNNYQEERWAKWDEPALKKAIEDGGGTYISNDAKSSAVRWRAGWETARDPRAPRGTA